MTTTEFSPAGPGYWFLADDPVDRLADEECPLDEIEEAAQAEEDAAQARLDHWRRCSAFLSGPHSAEECPR